MYWDLIHDQSDINQPYEVKRLSSVLNPQSFVPCPPSPVLSPRKCSQKLNFWHFSRKCRENFNICILRIKFGSKSGFEDSPQLVPAWLMLILVIIPRNVILSNYTPYDPDNLIGDNVDHTDGINGDIDDTGRDRDIDEENLFLNIFPYLLDSCCSYCAKSGRQWPGSKKPSIPHICPFFSTCTISQ